ncbi:MAG: hypothetical protein ACJAUP_002018 [Cellvibrionaceae bacterium]|jgi:hypothetical protein
MIISEILTEELGIIGYMIAGEAIEEFTKKNGQLSSKTTIPFLKLLTANRPKDIDRKK